MKLDISLTDEEKTALLKAKSQADIPHERITMIHLANEGMTAQRISLIVGTNAQTVRRHLRAYKLHSIQGLSRNFSPGRPSERKESLIPFLKLVLLESPTKYGWDKATWDSTSIIETFKIQSAKMVSHDTVTRAMKELGYSYKKPQKSPSINAPSKVEKLEQINKIINLIHNELDDCDANIYCTDESHFTNEPYLPRGYFLKGRQNMYSWTKEKRDSRFVWVIESANWTILLEKCPKRKF